MERLELMAGGKKSNWSTGAQQFAQSPPKSSCLWALHRVDAIDKSPTVTFPPNASLQCPIREPDSTVSPGGLNFTVLKHSPLASVFVFLLRFSANRWCGSASSRSAAISIPSSALAAQMTLTLCEISFGSIWPLICAAHSGLDFISAVSDSCANVSRLQIG